MRWLKMLLVPASLLALFLCHGPPAPAPAAPPPASGAGPLIDLLPESTILVVEIRELAARWPEVRAVPAIARFLDRLLAGSGLEPDDLPRLAGDAALLALLPAADGGAPAPVAVLRPPDPEEAEEILEALSLPVDQGAPPALHHARGALWVGLPEAEEDLKRIAAGDGTSARTSLVMEEAYRRLPEGGLIRGWVNPAALHALLGRRVEGVRSAPFEILRSVALAGLRSIRFIGFRRDLADGGAVADGVIGLEEDALPDAVARALASAPGPPLLLPSPLPPETLLASSFRLEGEACLAWLRHAAAGDPRGPLRNLDFWMEEFRERTGLDLDRDLAGALGERGWLFALEVGADGLPGTVVVLETHDPRRLEEALLALGDWLGDHLRGRTLYSMQARLHHDSLNGWPVHGLTLATPFAEVRGPLFLVTDEHLVAASGERSLEAGLRLIEGRERWMRAEEAILSRGDLSASIGDARRTPGGTLEYVRAAGPALARWIDALEPERGAGSAIPDPGPRLAPAVSGLLAATGTITAIARYEEGAVRIHVRVTFPD